MPPASPWTAPVPKTHARIWPRSHVRCGGHTRLSPTRAAALALASPAALRPDRTDHLSKSSGHFTAAMKTRRRRLRCLGSEGDLVAEPLQATHEIARGQALFEAVQVADAQIPVRQSRGQHVIRGDEDLVADGHGGSLGAAARAEAVELIPEI